MKVSAYVRQIAINADVKISFCEEERHFVRQLFRCLITLIVYKERPHGGVKQILKSFFCPTS